MSVIITGIEPKPVLTSPDKVSAHLSINNFQWKNPQTQVSGVSSRILMFDWIVNKQGKAFVKKGDNYIPVLGANSQIGPYIRCAIDGEWTDDLLGVNDFVV